MNGVGGVTSLTRLLYFCKSVHPVRDDGFSVPGIYPYLSFLFWWFLSIADNHRTHAVFKDPMLNKTYTKKYHNACIQGDQIIRSSKVVQKRAQSSRLPFGPPFPPYRCRILLIPTILSLCGWFRLTLESVGKSCHDVFIFILPVPPVLPLE